MIHALFDERRRKEIRDAIGKGRPIEFRCGKTGQDFPTGEADFGAYVFRYAGSNGAGVKMDVSIGRGREELVLPPGKETEVRIPDGRVVRLTARKGAFDGYSVSVDVEGAE